MGRNFAGMDARGREWGLLGPREMLELKKLSDQDLLTITAQVADKERRITIELMRLLREVEHRQLFIELGYPSLYDYVSRELRFSQGASYRRIQTMRLIKDVPRVEKLISDGTLNIQIAAKVQSVAAKWPIQDKEELLKRVEGKTTREAEREFARADPKGPREFTRWLDGETVQLTFPLCREAFQSLQELLSLRTHVDVLKTYKVVFTDLIKIGQEKWNPLRRNATSAPRSRCVNGSEEDTIKTLTPKIRAEVWKRDGGLCAYRNPTTNARCTTRDLLQIDHILPLALGGKNELSNLRLLCSAHNRARAEKTFGPML